MKVKLPIPQVEIPDWEKLQSQINIVIGSVRENALTLAQLKKDILDTFAYDLSRAAETYEYETIEEMLSDMKDYVQVRQTSTGVIVSALVIGASAHVTEMIQKTKTKRKPNRTPFLRRPGFHPQYRSPQFSRGRGRGKRGGASFRNVPVKPLFASSNPSYVPRPSSSQFNTVTPVLGSSSIARVPRYSSYFNPRKPVFGSSNPNYVPRPSSSQFHPGMFGSSTSSHVAKPSPSPMNPVKPVFGPATSSHVPKPTSSQINLVKPLFGSSNPNYVPRPSSSQFHPGIFGPSTSSHVTKPSPSQINPVEPVLGSSTPDGLPRSSQLHAVKPKVESSNPQNSAKPTSSQGLFGPPLSTQDSSINLWRQLLVKSKSSSSNRPIPPPRASSSNRPIPPPRTSILNSKVVPEKILAKKPRTLSQSEALIWQKKTFADYASKVSFKSAIKN